MNKSAIQKFAIWARNELITQVSQRAYQYGIDESGFGDASADAINGRLLSVEEKSQRQELINQIKEKGYNQVMEEVAYTWFNRFIALRFMEVNNYLPSHIRVFSDASGAFKPEILNNVLHLDLPELDRDKVKKYIDNSDPEGLYRYLLLTQCNALNTYLPVMFERMGSYTEMLLPNNILRQDSIIGHMVYDIPEEDWKDAVQIIGWLYQYYNTELKNDTFAQLKKNVKITKERIPAATQLFTPEWIVRYMVENSLGRLWLEGHPNAELHDSWKYYLDEAEQEPEVEEQLVKIRDGYKTINPEEIKVIDPCMGSGHILVYAFDVLMQIYTSAGWDQREAAQSILRNNLYGLDIDDRAAQLAYFAVMMKARQYDRRLFSRDIQPNLYSICESNGIQTIAVECFHKNDPKLKADIEQIITDMNDAKEYGSIINITPVDFSELYTRFDDILNDGNMMHIMAIDELLPLVKCAEVLTQKYHVVVTNPPYMTISNAGEKVNNYVKKYYPDSKSDMFAVFIELCKKMVNKNGYQAMITQHSWMFLSSYEKLRKKLFTVDIVNMVHLGARAFEEIGGEVVQTTAFVIRKSHIAHYKGKYCRLIEPTSQQEKENMFLVGEERYLADQSNFSKIPGSPVAYWIPELTVNLFEKMPKLGELCISKTGMTTGNNNRFLRLWQEVNCSQIAKKWFFYNKGGGYRKWYGSLDYLIIWENDGEMVKSANCSTIRNPNYYFKRCISWNLITSDKISVRALAPIFVMGDAGPACYIKNDNDYWNFLALLNSVVSDYLLKIINPTINNSCGVMEVFPVCADQIRMKFDIAVFAKQNVTISNADWDSYETSWDFKRNPLV